MKLRHVACAALATLASQAYALDPATVNNAATLKVYFSGASATKASIGQLFTQNCNAATRTDYTLASDANFGTIYSCTLNGTNDFGLGGINVAFQKRDAGGSGQGVYPVANGNAIAFIDPTTCTGPASGVGTCSAQFNRVPDGGTSDVEPAVFTPTLNNPAPFSGPLNLGAITIRPFVSTIFGLAVTDALYAKLQQDQGIGGRPSVPKDAVSTMLRNNFPFDSVAWRLLLPNTNDGTQNRQVTVCRRVNGSGTQASANRFWLEYPFNSGINMEPWTSADSSTGSHGIGAGQLYVVNNSANADVINCMNAANAAGSFAIGHISYENAEPAVGWKFASISGREGGRENTKSGQYPYFFEATCQFRNVLTGNARTFSAALCAGATSPDNLNALSAAAQNGVMTPPQNPACQAAVPTANAVKFCSRVTRDGNSANFPSFF
ncbi:MAG: hypothetical protein HC937_03575 [Aquincola sp.]|nr:hypothetical protein [Aquincola sp.]